MRKAKVSVEIEVEVEYDETKFTDEWMDEFRGYMYDFDTVEEHIEHLAHMYACGMCNDGKHNWPEGYGPLCDMGISIGIGDIDTHTWSDDEITR